MEMKRIITEALRAYRQYGRRIHVPQVVKTIERPDYVRMSSLGLCPLKAAREKLGIIPDIPELTYEQDDSKAWLMDRGNYTAAQIQEALMYYAMINTDVRFEPEVELINHDYRLTGRADGLIGLRSGNLVTGGQNAILEIKDTEGQKKRSVGYPRLNYAYQTMAYMRTANVTLAYIITTSKWKRNLYALQDEGKGVVVYNDRWDVLDPTEDSWDDKAVNWNTQEFLSWDAWEREVDRHHQYLAAHRAGKGWDAQTPLPAPIADPLNDDGAFQCAWHYKKATAKSDGEMKPACPWATSCHGLHARVYKTVKEGGQYKFKEPV